MKVFCVMNTDGYETWFNELVYSTQEKADTKALELMEGWGNSAGEVYVIELEVDA